ncbi:MAG: DUF3769 domain-containing protein [Spirulinaceae cyanobacterium]
MSIPVPPPETPVLTQARSAEIVNQTAEAIAIGATNSQKSPLAIPERFAPEFYSAKANAPFPSRELYSQDFSPLIKRTAADLGKPITIGCLASAQPNISQSNKSSHQVTTKNEFTPTSTVISGLTEDAERTILLTQERNGESREFELTIPVDEDEQEEDEPTIPGNEEETTTPATPTAIPIEPADVVEITSDRQEYDEARNIVTAEGNVEIRFSRAVLTADRVQVNLDNQITVAEGNVALRRGDQTIRGSRFEYYFVQDSGIVLNASGEIYQPTTGRDFNPTLANDPLAATIPDRPLSDRVTAGQPLQRISTDEGYRFVVGGSPEIGTSRATSGTGGTINRLRFQADRVDFYPEGWDATNIRITNDPFSPPELEIQADTARSRKLGPLLDEVVTSNSRVVFDQGFSLPLFRNRFLLDRRPRQPTLFNVGLDGNERGGVFIERSFDIINSPQVFWSVTPQYFLQRAIFDENPGAPSAFGVKSNLDVIFSPRTTLRASVAVTSFDLDEIGEETRASVRGQQIIGRTNLPHHTLGLEYSYRDRLFNGSLGFQDVRSTLGAVITSPVIPIGNTGVNLTYQGAIQNINADTDRLDLLAPIRDNNRVNLTRYQAAASLGKGFSLWRGEALPPTPTEGLRYSPVPIQPYLALYTGITGVSSLYSSGDTQQSLGGSIGLRGQFGHFSKKFLDYTAFNLTFSGAIVGDQSPFRFDRFVDRQTVSFGITQQLYGPFRFGFQTAYNLDTSQEINTTYSLEYSRRTYNILLQYNPVQEFGSLSFRISDFNWTGSPDPFDADTINPVVQGVRRE